MIKIIKNKDFATADNDGRQQLAASCYAIAGQSLVFSSPVAALKAYAQVNIDIGPPESSLDSIAGKALTVPLGEHNAELLYTGLAPFNDRLQAVDCWRQNQIMQIDVGGEAICRADIESDYIVLLNDRDFDDRLNLEVVTGPALIVLLAARGVFCLHAGAVATEYGNIALIAESGVGKSTLSAHVDHRWRQLCDDILPICPQGNSHIIADYPQLKLPGNCAISPFPTGASINLVVRLMSRPATEITFRHLHRTDAVLQIIRHTVAAKMFDHSMLRSQARFAETLSRVTPVVELGYPRDILQLADLRSALSNYLRDGKFS